MISHISFRLLAVPLLLICFHAHTQHTPVPTTAFDLSPLLIGEKAPDVVLKDVHGKEEKLLQVLSKKPSVLIFYRGGWCPYCNLHLAELQEIEKEILSLGFQIVAISPDSPGNLVESIGKHSLNYTLLSDSGMKAARGFGIAYQVSESQVERLRNSSGGENPGQLPVPAVFIMNESGEIEFEYINPDYKKRVKSAVLLAVLKTIR